MQNSIIRSEEGKRPSKRRASSSAKQGDSSEAAALQSARVLVVDDQVLLREAVAFEFEMLGCEAFQAENGEQALRRFRELNPEIIISDIRMPVWDGVRLLDEVRRISRHSPAFIFMTGFSDLQLPMAYQRGADAFLTKPLYPETLESTLRRLLVPMEKRWQVLTTESAGINVAATYPTLEDAIAQKSIMLGRCGLFLNKTLLPRNFPSSLERLVAFHFRFQSGALKSIEGLGRVRWVREKVDGAPAGLGLEYEFLAQPGRDETLRYIRDNNLLSVIPDGSAAQG